MDIFHAKRVEDQVALWLDDPVNQKHIRDIAESLVPEATGPLTLEQALIQVPPPPPKDTNPGYNRQLDKRRPKTFIGYLQ